MAGGAIAGGVLSLVGAGVSAAISAKAAKTAFKRARKFRRSAYQDTVFDLRAAGLNPILAFGRGPTAGTTFAPARVPDFAQGVSASAVGLSKLRAELDLLSATADRQRAEAAKAGMQSKKVELEVKEFKPTLGGVARRFLESGKAKEIGRRILEIPNWIRDRLKSAAER